MQPVRASIIVTMLAATILVGGSRCLGQTEPQHGPDITIDEATSIDQALREAMKRTVLAETTTDIEQGKRAYQDALRLAKYVLNRDPLNVTADYILARLDLRTDRPRPREDIAKIETYVDNPAGHTDWYAHKLLGDLYLESYAERARSQYERAAELAPTEAQAIIGLAEANLKLGRAKEAVEFAERAIVLEPEEDASFRVTLADALLAADRPDDAAAKAKEAVRISEEKVRAAPGKRGMLLELQEQYELLGKCLSALAGLYPERPVYAIELARSIQDRADLSRLLAYHDALNVLNKWLQLGRGTATPDLLYEQARLLRLVGRTEQAVDTLRALLETFPNHAPARALLASITGEATPVDEPTEAPQAAASQ